MKELKQTESWYAIHMVYIVIALGLLSSLLGNFWFKYVGILTVILGLITLYSIYKRKKEVSKDGK